jgi:CubicO group peptidase (beta-lactamase class C family)
LTHRHQPRHMGSGWGDYISLTKSTTSPDLCLGTIFLTIVLLVGVASGMDLPVNGQSVPGLAVFDDAMIEFMETHGIEAGLLGVMIHGVVVLERGYGWKDAEHTEAVPSTAMMRIASVTKPITSAAIRKLVDAG